MTKPKTPGEKMQKEMERFRGPPAPARPQHISKPQVTGRGKQNFKSPRGK